MELLELPRLYRSTLGQLSVAMLLALLTSTAMAAQTGDSVPACPIDADPMQGWDTRAPAKKIFGNTYYVGTCGIASVLVTSKQGLILIDGATEKAGPLITANIEALGFMLGDVKYILNTHEHSDHAGGIAYLQRVTGAQVLARTPAVTALEHGTSTSDDPQFGQLEKFPPVIKVQPLTDGQVLRMGELTLTVHATPGHAPGSSSWTWTSCEGARCLNIGYADSLSSISDKGYRYIQHPAYVQAFRAGIDTVGALPCDILITPHPAASNLFARLAGKAPLIDAGACKRYAADARINLEKRLQGEKKATTP